MRLIRLFLFALIAVTAVSVTAAATASAAFHPWHYLGPHQTVTLHISPGRLVLPSGVETSQEFECRATKGTALVEEPTTFGNIKLTFTGCKVREKSGHECGIKSAKPEGGPGEILTFTIDGLLAAALPSLEPALWLFSLDSTHRLTVIESESTECSIAAAVEANPGFAALILLEPNPTVLGLDLHIVFGKNNPKAVLLLNGQLDETKLNIGGRTGAYLELLVLALFPKDFRLC